MHKRPKEQRGEVEEKVMEIRKDCWYAGSDADGNSEPHLLRVKYDETRS